MANNRIHSGLLRVAAILAFAAHLGFAGQSQAPEYKAQSDIAGRRGGNLVVAVPSDPASFNRMCARSLANATIADLLSGDLVHIDRATFELEPALAADWKSEQDGRAYFIRLRRGLKFSDGSPMTAEDVIFSFQALQNPKSQAIQAGQVMIDDRPVTVSKVDAYAVRVTFPRTVGMGLRAFDSVPILPKARLQKAYDEGTFSSAWGPGVAPSDVVGMGPFRLREYQRGVKVVLERNPYYWKKDRSGETLPYLDSITILIVPDKNSEALRFQSGELHMASPLNAENYALLRRDTSRTFLKVQDLGPGLAMDFLWFNLNFGNSPSGKPWVDPEKLAVFDRAEFRQAISRALDREGMIRTILLGLGSPQYGPVSSGNKVWFDPSVARTEYNPARARELLDTAGIRDSDGDGLREFGAARRPMEISLSTARGNVAREKMAQIIKDDLRKIGIVVDIQLLLPNELVARFLNTFEYDGVLFGLTPTDVAPDLQTDLWYSSGQNHFWQPGQPKPQRPWEAEMDALTSQLVRSIDPAARLKFFQNLQRIWARELPAISTIAPNILVGWNARVGNLRPSILAPHLLWNCDELTMDSK